MVQPPHQQPLAEDKGCYANNGLLYQRIGRRLDRCHSNLPFSSLIKTSTFDYTVVRVLTSVLHALRYNSTNTIHSLAYCSPSSWQTPQESLVHDIPCKRQLYLHLHHTITPNSSNYKPAINSIGSFHKIWGPSEWAIFNIQIMKIQTNNIITIHK